MGQVIGASIQIMYEFLRFCDGDFEGAEKVVEAINLIAVSCKKILVKND